MVYSRLCSWLLRTTLALIFTVDSVYVVQAQQNTDTQLYKSIRQQDSLLFDVGFNTCNTAVMEQVVADSFEFYHDQAGMLKGKQAFINSVKNHVCNLPYQARRQLDVGSMQVYPLYTNSGTLYGAIQNGTHRFYAIEKDKPEYLTSKAKFTHLWTLDNGQWKLLRSLSYDHHDYEPETPLDLDDSLGIAALLQEVKVPALGIGIISDGKLQQVKMYGELEKGRPAPANAVFNIASITKTMTAMLVLRLVSAGQWDLDQPLCHYWTDPDVAADPRSKLITTRNILNQESGFTNWRREQPGQKLAFVATPGTEYRYSGEGFEYLRHALEQKFHCPLNQIADSVLFRPLGMKDTHYTWSRQTDTSRMAMPHNAAGKKLGITRNDTPNAADLVTTTIPDLSRFLISVMNKEGLSKAIAAEMERPAVKTKDKRYVGLCWFVYTPIGQGEYALSHGGDDPGMHSICFILPKSKKGVIIFTNSDNGPRQLFAPVIKTCLKDAGKEIVDIEMK